MNFKLKILFLGLLLVLCVNSVSAADSLNNITLNDDVLLDGSDYVVGETILIDHDVSIAAKDYSTISAENNNVIFNVSSNAKLTLSNLNLTNANGVKGGAIYNNGVLVLNNCTFVNNKATFGGAIYNNGTMILNNCTFEFNIVSVSGGAIYNLQDDLTIHDSTFIGNYAKIKNGILQGGAIANYANNLTVDNCSFVKNHLFNTNWYKNGKMYGGAIYNSGNNLIVKNSKFNGNYIYGYTDSMNKHVDLSDKYGGAVYSNADISAFLNNEFDSNEIYSMLSSYVTKKVYLSNKGIASAIAAYNKVIIINNTFLNNSAACPPINIDNGERCIILNNTFINNNARSLAQSIKMDGNNTFIAGNTFYRDENAVDKGYFENPDYWKVYEILIDGGVNNTISYNYFENSNGIHYLNSFGEDKTANLTISNNVFNNSKKSVFVEHINNVDITSNVFINSNYAISTYTGRHINIKNNYFYGGGSDNSSHRGYLDINSHFTDISGNVFRKIGAEDSLGPVIYIKVRDNITIAENAFIENTVAHGNGIISSLFGGFYYIDGITDVDGPLGNVEVNHNYFANNSLNDGAIFESRASKINIENNIIENNEGLIILANETYYKTQYMNFTKNQIKDFTGDIMDYSYFYNSKNFDGSANEEYTGDSTSFLDKIFDFVKNLWDEYVKGKNSVKDPNNVDTNKNTTSSGSDVADNTDDSRDDIKSNSTDSSGDSDVGDSLDKSHYSAKNSLSESESNVGDSSSGLSSDSSSPEVHELEKSNVSKDIADDNYLIWIVLVIVVIFALLAIGYNKR
ncbi:MAG TPA: adhesin [Methanobrevibacter smithii]|nr:adhesin [Methanobrevibacter smithii]HJJ02639.1 adhesin [Methanobrevibacter smithii]